jgi:6-phosphogluconate dehydrogenase
MPDGELALIGLGRMGGALALRALEKGMRVAGYSKNGASEDLKRAGLIEAASLDQLRGLLKPPRLVMLYIPAGPGIDTVLASLAAVLQQGDIVADGGNSYWGDSIRRHRRMARANLRFADLGTSGGPSGARHGPCFMVGGERETIALIDPILRRLAIEQGYVHAGPPGAGHFVKLVHNGIEFGMLQAIAEGFDLLTHYHDRLDIAAVLESWRHGSVVRSWLLDLLTQAYRDDPKLTKPSSYIEDTGEVNWLVSDAIGMEVPIPAIATAVMQLIASRDPRKNWARAIVLMRHAFGGHPFGPDAATAHERHVGRVGDCNPNVVDELFRASEERSNGRDHATGPGV